MADPDLMTAETFIRNQLVNDATLVALLGGARIYSEAGPTMAVYPLIIYQHMGGQDILGMGSQILALDEIYLVKVVGQENSYVGLAPIYRRIHTLLHRISGTVSGVGLVLGCRREYPFKMTDLAEDGGVIFRHLGGGYRIFSQ